MGGAKEGGGGGGVGGAAGAALTGTLVDFPTDVAPSLGRYNKEVVFYLSLRPSPLPRPPHHLLPLYDPPSSVANCTLS